MPTYWIVVGSPENFRIAIGRGFDLFGFKSTRRRETGEMRPGDKLVFYLTGSKKFGGIASVASESFEDHTPVFRSEKKPGEDYPFRVKTKADIVLDESQWLDVPDYVPRLEFTKKGATKSWALFFQGNLHRIAEADYKLIEKEMRALEEQGGIESEGRAESQGGGEGARVAVPDERILTKHPQGKSGVSIEKAKYDAVRAAIVGALRGEQLSFSQMRDKVATQLSPGSFDGSISWYTECVKLDLEARGAIERVPNTRPQKLRLLKG